MIQAAASKVPVISTYSPGCIDAVKEGYNGLLVEVKNQGALEKAIETYILDEKLRKQHAENGPSWAANFSQEKIWDGLDKLYKEALTHVNFL